MTRDEIVAVINAVASGELVSDHLRTGQRRMAFYTALERDPQLQELYTVARASRAEELADEVVRVADDPELEPARARNMVDARRWLASKLRPQVYGDRLDVNVQQSVDISVALKEARSRVRLPDRYPRSIPTPVIPLQVADAGDGSSDADSEGDAEAPLGGTRAIDPYR